MKRSVRFLMVAALLLPAAACSNVDSLAMLGTPLADKEAAEFAGVWLYNDQMPIYVTQRGGGAVHFAIVNRQDDGFQLSEFDGVLTEDEGTVYLNFEKKPETDDGAVTYQFLRLTRMGDDTYYVHPANDEGFAAAVESGQLSGEVVRNEDATFKSDRLKVHVDASAEEVADFVRPDKASEQFNLEFPMYLHRLTRYE